MLMSKRSWDKAYMTKKQEVEEASAKVSALSQALHGMRTNQDNAEWYCSFVESDSSKIQDRVDAIQAGNSVYYAIYCYPNQTTRRGVLVGGFLFQARDK